MNDMPLDSTDLTWLARLARALIGESHAADDLVQETVVAALEGNPPIPVERRRAWLGAVARNLAARTFRGRSRRTRRERAVAQSEALPDSAELVERAELAEQVTVAARALPEPFRRAVLLRFLEGLSSREIAEREGKPVDTVRARVRRGLDLLRDELVRRYDRGDWAAWSVLLIPLARMRGDAGLAAAGASGGLAGAAAWWMILKTKWTGIAAGLAAVLCVGGLLWSAETDSGSAPPTIGDGVAAERAELGPQNVEPAATITASTERVAVGESPAEETVPDADVPEVRGRVIDDLSEPVPDATVYFVGRGSDGAYKVGRRTQTDASGSFRLLAEDSDTPVELGVVANGFLRSVTPQESWSVGLRDEFVVRLDRGGLLTGRVVDPYGRGVPGLEMLVHTARAPVEHVSLSKVRIYANRALLGGANSSYEEGRAWTDANGSVLLRGLPEGKLTARSLDPAWVIADPSTVTVQDGTIIWTALPRFGVRLEVVDAKTGLRVDRAGASFGLEVTLTNGEFHDYSQWVGSGRDGIVTFSFEPGELVGRNDLDIASVKFYGAAGAGSARAEWEAEPLLKPGVAEVRVPIDGIESEDEPLKQVSIEFDVRHPDDVPFEGQLAVRWRSKLVEGAVREDSEIAERVGPGRYRLEVPAGLVYLSVADGQASGSLERWTGKVRCETHRPAKAFVTLPRGAAVTITRPLSWRGNWSVHASWRPVGEEEWRGSWGYGTDTGSLRLTALREAEWRFRLRGGADREEDAVERVVTLRAGDDKRVVR